MHMYLNASVQAGEPYTVKVRGGRISELEFKHITSEFCVWTMRGFLQRKLSAI